MSANLYRAFKAIFPDQPLQVAEVTAVDGGVAVVTLPGGGVLTVRGTATVGDQVFVRDGVIEAKADDLPVVVIEI